MFKAGDRVQIVGAPEFPGSERLLGLEGVITKAFGIDDGTSWPFNVRITTKDTVFTGRIYAFAGNHLRDAVTTSVPPSPSGIRTGDTVYFVSKETAGDFKEGDAVTIHTSIVGDAVDSVNHPPHYNRFPVEVINITEQLDFNRGNAVKYLARAGYKAGVDELEDLSKAAWYVARAIEKLKRERESDDG